MIIDFRNWFLHKFLEMGLSEGWAIDIAEISCLLCIITLALLATYLLQRCLIPFIMRMVESTNTRWDDYLINIPVLRALFLLLPSLLAYQVLPYCVFNEAEPLFRWLSRFTQAYIAFSCMQLVIAFLKNLKIILTERYNEHNTIGIIQFLRIITVCLGALIIISYIIGRNHLRIIAGLGAAATVLMLIFKDFLLGIEAGIQLSMNNMLKVGDWITIHKLNIDGTVEEVSLTTIKVRNFDNTISTVPPQTLVSDTFKNWDAMFQHGFRRVKRAIFIDVHSIRFVDENLRNALKQKKLISKNDESKQRITNLTLFRHHITNTLKTDSHISDKQWILARQLEPTPNGLPLEIWFYTSETSFGKFEDFASDYLEYFIAIMKEFDLIPFQTISGVDILKNRYAVN